MLAFDQKKKKKIQRIINTFYVYCILFSIVRNVKTNSRVLIILRTYTRVSNHLNIIVEWF